MGIAPQDSFDRDTLDQFREDLKTTKFRDIFYEVIEKEYGAHVILHFNEDFSLPKRSDEQPSERDFILSRIDKLEDNMGVSVFYMGGAHGGYEGLSTNKQLSGLDSDSVLDISNALKAKNLSMHSGMLQSCYSALFLSYFRSLLSDENAPLLSYSAEVGGGSAWEMIINWVLQNQKGQFFSDAALAKPWEQGDLITTTSVLSTQYSDQLMDLTQSDVSLPDYIEQNEETEFQRELVMDVLKGEAEHAASILIDLKTEVDSFNEVSVMTSFNEWLTLSLEPVSASELGAASGTPP